MCYAASFDGLPPSPLRVLLIDNFDSYTQNLYHALAQSGCEVSAAGGAVLVCPGENSERLSLYRVSDGATLSRGVVGYDATALLGGGADRNAPIVAAAPGGALQAFFLEVSERPTQAL